MHGLFAFEKLPENAGRPSRPAPTYAAKMALGRETRRHTTGLSHLPLPAGFFSVWKH
jgi:hypothetical protein